MGGYRDKAEMRTGEKPRQIWLFIYSSDVRTVASIGTEEEEKNSGVAGDMPTPRKIELSDELQADIRLLTKAHPLARRARELALARLLAHSYSLGIARGKEV